LDVAMTTLGDFFRACDVEIRLEYRLWSIGEEIVYR
jgi:hypothetical protein